MTFTIFKQIFEQITTGDCNSLFMVIGWLWLWSWDSLCCKIQISNNSWQTDSVYWCLMRVGEDWLGTRGRLLTRRTCSEYNLCTIEMTLQTLLDVRPRLAFIECNSQEAGRINCKGMWRSRWQMRPPASLTGNKAPCLENPGGKDKHKHKYKN